VENPKKRVVPQGEMRQANPEELERQISNLASSLAAGRGLDGEAGEELCPCWIENRQLIRILAPFVSMN